MSTLLSYKNSSLKILCLTVSLSLVFIYFFNLNDVSFAADGTGHSAAGSGQNQSGSGQNPDLTQSNTEGVLHNPLSGTNSVEEFILKIIDVVLIFLFPIIILYIMYAGFLYVTARGDSGQISKAHNALLYAVIGGVIVLGARLIVDIIKQTITTI